MQSNEYLADALLLLLPAIPACLVAAKLAYPSLPWALIWMATPVLSWIVANATLWAYPPDNGLAGAVMLFTGWFHMLPILGVFALAGRPLLQWSGSGRARVAAAGLFMLTAGLPVSACFRWIPEAQAREIARRELIHRGHPEFEIRAAERTWNGWILHVRLPDQADHPVYLSRSGFLLGTGG